MIEIRPYIMDTDADHERLVDALESIDADFGEFTKDRVVMVFVKNSAGGHEYECGRHFADRLGDEWVFGKMGQDEPILAAPAGMPAETVEVKLLMLEGVLPEDWPKKHERKAR
jgi:hypothetical protein